MAQCAQRSHDACALHALTDAHVLVQHDIVHNRQHLPIDVVFQELCLEFIELLLDQPLLHVRLLPRPVVRCNEHQHQHVIACDVHLAVMGHRHWRHWTHWSWTATRAVLGVELKACSTTHARSTALAEYE